MKKRYTIKNFYVKKIVMEFEIKEGNYREDGSIWSAQVGATRRFLKLIDKERLLKDKTVAENIKVSFVKYPNATFVFVNKYKMNDKEIETAGLYFGIGYDFTLTNVLEDAWSCARRETAVITLLQNGGVVEIHSYKNRRGSDFLQVTENGFAEKIQTEIDNIEKILKEEV